MGGAFWGASERRLPSPLSPLCLLSSGSSPDSPRARPSSSRSKPPPASPPHPHPTSRPPMCKTGRASTYSEAGPAGAATTAPPLVKVALLGDSQVKQPCSQRMSTAFHAAVRADHSAVSFMTSVRRAGLQVGKTSLMNRFVECTFDDTELQTQVSVWEQCRPHCLRHTVFSQSARVPPGSCMLFRVRGSISWRSQ